MKQPRLLWLLPLLILFLVPATAWTAPEREQNSSKECSMCHLRWMDDFLEDKGNYLLEIPDERAVSKEMMCYSCHDGSISDSRFRVWETNKHKAGVIPSDSVSIPEEYPLDLDGKMQCVTCHSAHGVDTRITMESAIFLREPNINSSMCQRCHKNKDTGPQKGNHPIDVEFKEFPKEIIQSGGKNGENSSIICESCHAAHGSTNDDFLIIPNSEASLTQSMLCEACHGLSPDLSSSDALRHYTHPMDVELPKDADLPEKWDNGETPYLGQGKYINCRTCHSPHNGTDDNHLLVQYAGGDPLCLTCHTSKESIYYTRHDISESFPDDVNSAGVKTIDKGACNACHFMHKGQGPLMWARDPIKGSIDEMCISCHNREGIAKEALTGKKTHPVGKTFKDAPKSLPLFAEDGKRSANGKVRCPTCHDVHRWSPDSNNPGHSEVPGNGNNRFLRKSVTTGALCQSCHKAQAAIAGTKHDLRLAAPDEKNFKDQSLKESGVCGGCHTPHNANRAKLWARKTGAGIEIIERTCNSCHKKGGLAEDKTTGKESHPLQLHVDNMDPAAKEMLPLFAKGGIKSADGFVSCATCHNVHQWDPSTTKAPGNMKVEGDRMTSFLRIPNDNSAKLCASCHKQNSYVVGTDHDLSVTAPRERNMEQQTVAEGGVCSACHMVHNAWGNGLWSRSVGLGENRNEARCSGCHWRRKSASKKILRGPNHPMNKRVDEAKPFIQGETASFYVYGGSAKIKTELPLFARDGFRTPEGDITCPTCHNVHVWDPEKAAPGSGEKGQEGDGGNSFLRKSNLPNSQLCTTCHTKKVFIQGTDHDMSIVAPDSKNRIDQTVAQSGICSACHLPHNAQKDGYKLWGRNLGKSDGLKQERLCLGCHTENGVGKRKIVTNYSHPREILVAEAHRIGDKGYAPVYDNEGNEVQAGMITCATCHEPHIWAPGKEKAGPGKQTEGTNQTSFLRFKSAKNICRNCHGLDSLQKFKYFHSTSSRRGGYSRELKPRGLIKR
ncbi:MAG: cytochrome c3 family protein [Candidatus Polarisedimenticolaceae bacterium]|nr:cytochrome c3 family protein [Candidatus Polarisedimenticolaceae bacterium]